MIINFIRHGKTAGNIQKKYIGRTDEPLCAEGVAEIKSNKYPSCDIVIASPMKRCIQTADIIYPDKKLIICDDFRECDFGDFEGKNYLELSGSPDYQKWIDSNGTDTFPNGENPQNFRKRCVEIFLKAIQRYSDKKLSLVVHGGIIMSVMEKFAVPKRDYYDYQIKNGHGFVTEYSDGKIIIMEEI
ncbi:MAG: histidine phosphatase family protein [Ruminococcus sp.]|nr:histidine phosphatase family protein [Ruminococcus sp.]